MFIVGELINASRKPIRAAIEARDAAEIQKVAVAQIEAGANYIDVNAGVFVHNEADYLQWLVEIVQEATGAPCCIDSPDPKAIAKALAVHRGIAMINSISLEKERYEGILPLIAGTEHKIVALCMSDAGMPESSADRLAVADKLINGLVQNNIALDNIYVDPLVQPVSTKDTFGIEFLEAVEKIMQTYQGVHTMCGLSNISYGLPARKLMNQSFAVMAIDRGLDGLIINPLDQQMMANIIAAETIAGRDFYCADYLNAYRGGKLA